MQSTTKKKKKRLAYSFSIETDDLGVVLDSLELAYQELLVDNFPTNGAKAQALHKLMMKGLKECIATGKFPSPAEEALLGNPKYAAKLWELTQWYEALPTEEKTSEKGKTLYIAMDNLYRRVYQQHA